MRLLNGSTEKEWMEIIHKCKQSGLTISAWCRENGVSETAYYYHQRKMQRPNENETNKESSLMKRKYVIAGDYYTVTELQGNEVYFGKQCFLGVEGPRRIYVYDEGFTDNTLVFDTKAEANKYIKQHNLNDSTRVCTERHYVVTVYPND